MADDLVDRLSGGLVGQEIVFEGCPSITFPPETVDAANRDMREAAAEIARLRVHEHELGELLAVIFRDGGHHQAAVNDTHEAVAEAIQIVAQDRARPGWREGVEAAAAEVRKIAAHVPLAAIRKGADARVVADVTEIFDGVEAAIRALKEPT